jgi:hypothetical protein
MRTVAIPLSLYRILKRAANDQGMKVRTLTERLLKDGLARKATE